MTAEERDELRRLQGELSATTSALAEAQREVSKLRCQISGVCGALADAATVLCHRDDGDYGESVRALTAERDEARRELASLRERLAGMVQMWKSEGTDSVCIAELEAAINAKG